MAVQPLYYVKPEDIEKFEEIKRQLLSLIKKGKPIDGSIVMQLISLIPARGISLSEMIYKGGKVNEVLPKVYSWLNAITPYLSDGTYEFRGLEVPEKHFSIEHLIAKCAMDYMIASDCDNKKEAVMEFAKIVDSYIEEHVDERDKILLTLYKRYVLIGLLTHFVSGFKLIEKARHITKSSLYQAVRNTLKSKK
jgi:hypothetical protein